MEIVKGQVERVHFDSGERRELLLLLKVEPSSKLRYLELSLDRPDAYSRALRLTGVGDKVELTLDRSCNNIEGLQRFQNLTLESHMKFAETVETRLSRSRAL